MWHGTGSCLQSHAHKTWKSNTFLIDLNYSLVRLQLTWKGNFAFWASALSALFGNFCQHLDKKHFLNVDSWTILDKFLQTYHYPLLWELFNPDIANIQFLRFIKKAQKFQKLCNVYFFKFFEHFWAHGNVQQIKPIFKNFWEKKM